MSSTSASYIYNAPLLGFAATLTRSTDGAFVPCDLGNRDYQNFLSQIAAGMTPPSGWTGPTNPTGASS